MVLICTPVRLVAFTVTWHTSVFNTVISHLKWMRLLNFKAAAKTSTEISLERSIVCFKIHQDPARSMASWAWPKLFLIDVSWKTYKWKLSEVSWATCCAVSSPLRLWLFLESCASCCRLDLGSLVIFTPEYRIERREGMRYLSSPIVGSAPLCVLNPVGTEQCAESCSEVCWPGKVFPVAGSQQKPGAQHLLALAFLLAHTSTPSLPTLPCSQGEIFWLLPQFFPS